MVSATSTTVRLPAKVVTVKGEWLRRPVVRWSVGIEAEAGQVLTREQVVELADAVASSSGIATGIGSTRYGARLVVQAATRDEAVEQATAEFTRAAAAAGLPAAPIVTVQAVSEGEDDAGPPGSPSGGGASAS